MRQRIVYAIISMLVASGLLVAAPAFAQSTETSQPTQTQAAGGWGRGVHGRAPGVVGTVTAVSGDSISIQSKGFGKEETQTAYTVDATNATVDKNGASSTVAAIAVGDTLMVQGTVNGSTVTATAIHDGIPQKGPGMGMGGGIASQIQGNGEPVIGGSVSAINGNTLTVTNKSNVTYTVDATNAKIVKGNATSSLSSVATGDNVIVQGSVNGNAVTASLVIDQSQAQNSGTSTGPGESGFRGFMGAIGGFFRHVFGFF